MINDHNNGGYNLDEREIGLFMIIAAAVEVTFIVSEPPTAHCCILLARYVLFYYLDSFGT